MPDKESKTSIPSGIVGLGRIGMRESTENIGAKCYGEYSHFAGILSARSCHLVGAVDPHPQGEKLARLQAAGGLLYPNLDDLIRVGGAKFLAIATRTEGRVDTVLSAIRCGVGRLHVEKPLCQSEFELASMRTLVPVQGKTLFTYGTLRRFLPPFALAERQIAAGAIGVTQSIHVGVTDCRLFWSLPHAIDTALFLFRGQVTGFETDNSRSRLWAIAQDYGWRVDEDPLIPSLVIKFDGERRGFVEKSDSDWVEVRGSKGQIRIQRDGAAMAVYRSAKESVWTWSEQRLRGSVGYGRVFEALLSDAPPNQAFVRRSMSDAYSGQQLILRIARSTVDNQDEMAEVFPDGECKFFAMSDGKPA